jgi:hypothetical protein
MTWWYIISALSAGAVLWVGVAAYLRVRRQLKRTASTESAEKD